MHDGPMSRRPCVVALCLTYAFSAAGFAQPVGDEPAYTLQAATDRALSANPGLKAAGFEIAVARAHRDGAALPAPMSVQAEIENFLGSGAAGSFDVAETTLQLSRVLELGDKRDLRVGLGNARIGLAETERVLARLELSAEVARRFIDLLVLQEERAIADQAIALAASTIETVRRRVEVGSGLEAELATSEIALAEAELNRATLDARLAAARLRLAALWGDEEAGAFQAEAQLFGLPPPPSLATLKARIDSNPELVRSIDRRSILEAERRLAQTRERADLELNFGVRHLAETGDAALVFGASLPLGRQPRADAEVAAASAALERLAATQDQKRLELIALLAGLHAELTSARDHFEALGDSLLPRSERAAELYRQGFEVGRLSLLEFNLAQRDHLALQLEAVAAAGRYHSTLVDIEQLLGSTYESGVIR